MGKRIRRTPEQQAEFLRKQLAEAEKKAAIASAKSNPILLPLYEARAKFQTEIMLQSRNISDGPQSFASRRNNHKLWLAEIDALEAYSKVAGEHAKLCRETLDNRLQELSARISSGETITPEDIESALEFDTTPEYDAAYSALQIAQENRKNFRKSFDAAVDTDGEMEMAADN